MMMLIVKVWTLEDICTYRINEFKKEYAVTKTYIIR